MSLEEVGHYPVEKLLVTGVLSIAAEVGRFVSGRAVFRKSGSGIRGFQLTALFGGGGNGYVYGLRSAALLKTAFAGNGRTAEGIV